MADETAQQKTETPVDTKVCHSHSTSKQLICRCFLFLNTSNFSLQEEVKEVEKTEEVSKTEETKSEEAKTEKTEETTGTTTEKTETEEKVHLCFCGSAGQFMVFKKYEGFLDYI